MDLKLPPLSARIQKNAARMTRPHNIGAALVNPLESMVKDLSPEARPIQRANLDPDAMSRYHLSDESPVLERPDVVWDQLEEVTPQFFLRNTFRARMYADPEELMYSHLELRSLEWANDMAFARTCSFEKGTVYPDTSSDLLREHMAQRHELVVQTRWTDGFGRPDPSDD